MYGYAAALGSPSPHGERALRLRARGLPGWLARGSPGWLAAGHSLRHGRLALAGDRVARLPVPLPGSQAGRSLVAYLELRRLFRLLDGVQTRCPGNFSCS